MNKLVLSAHNIRKVYQGPRPLEVISNLSLNVFQGETIAITGKSGSGKSTLLSILGTLENATSGEISVCGQKTSSRINSTLRNKHIGFIFQSFHLLEDFSLIENVLMPAAVARNPTTKNSASYKRAYELLEEVGLSSHAHLPTKILSGGEKQRACLARALCNDPDLILADEPTGNLDSSNAQIVSAMLIQSAKKKQKTLILVTHDTELAALCDKTFQLKDGLLHRIR